MIDVKTYGCINQIKYFSQELSIIKTNELIAEIEEASIEKQIGLPYLQGDSSRLKQTLLGLIGLVKMKKPLGKLSVLACYLGQQALLWVSIQYHHNVFIHEIPLFDEKLQVYNRIILQSGGKLLAQVKAQSEGDLCSISFTLPMKVVSTPSAFDGASVG